MKQFLLLSVILLSFTISAQDVFRATPSEITGKTPGASVPITSILMLPQKPDVDKLLIIDTVFGPAYDLACSTAPALFLSDNSGFVSGTNGYFDLEKIQRIVLNDDYTFEVTEVITLLQLDSLAIVSGGLLDQKLVANVFTELPNDSTFGAFVGASDTLVIKDVQFDSTGLAVVSFSFSTPPSFTATGSFLIGIDFSDVYTNPTSGNIGIISTDDGCGDGSNVFETFINQDGGLSFGDIVTDWQGLNIEFFLGAVIDREPAVATRNPLANYGATATPNPATNDLAVTFTAPGNEQLTATLLTNDGRLVRSQSVSAGTGRVEWSVADLPAGLYLYQLAGSAGVQTGKVVVR